MLGRLACTITLSIALGAALAGTSHAAIGPANDLYATPTVIAVAGGVVTSDTTGASKEAGETPLKGIDNDWAWTTWYSWTLPVTALVKTKVSVDLCGADIASEPMFDPTRLSVIAAADGINGTPLAAAQDGCPVRVGGISRAPRFTFEATPGTDYRFVVGTPTSAMGSVTFALTPAPFATSTGTLTGLTQSGYGITATAPAWTAATSTTGPVWQRCNADGVTCFDIVGAYGPGYLLRTSDIGDRIRAVYTATNSVGTAVVATAATTAITKVDTDLDGTPDDADYDDDNDFVPDAAEITFRYDPLRVDSDGDGISDTQEACAQFQYCAQVLETKTFIVAKDGSNKLVEVVGTKGNDVIVTGSTQGTDGTITPTSSKSSTSCNGLAGNDTCIGGAAKDACVAGAGSDTCIGGTGADSCVSTLGKDVCFGGSGNDTCVAKVQLPTVSSATGAAVPKVAPPTTTCNGGTGNDSCSVTLSAPVTKTTTQILKLVKATGGRVNATCSGGTGNDTCTVAPRSWDPVSDAIATAGSFASSGIPASAAAAAKITATCSGGVGNDTCIAKDAVSWIMGDKGLAAAGTVMKCMGGAGNDLLLIANGKAGDIANGGGGKDICIADVGDTVTNCATTVVLDLGPLSRATANAVNRGKLDAAIAAMENQVQGNVAVGKQPQQTLSVPATQAMIDLLDDYIEQALVRLQGATDALNSNIDAILAAANARTGTIGRISGAA